MDGSGLKNLHFSHLPSTSTPGRICRSWCHSPSKPQQVTASLPMGRHRGAHHPAPLQGRGARAQTARVCLRGKPRRGAAPPAGGPFPPRGARGGVRNRPVGAPPTSCGGRFGSTQGRFGAGPGGAAAGPRAGTSSSHAPSRWAEHSPGPSTAPRAEHGFIPTTATRRSRKTTRRPRRGRSEGARLYTAPGGGARGAGQPCARPQRPGSRGDPTRAGAGRSPPPRPPPRPRAHGAARGQAVRPGPAPRAPTKAAGPLTRCGVCCPSASSGAPAAAGCCPSCRPRRPPCLPRPPRRLGRRPVRPPRRRPPAPRRPGGGGGGSGRAGPAARGRARERRATRGAGRAARPTDRGAPWARAPRCARSPRAAPATEGGRLCPRRRRSVPGPRRAPPTRAPRPRPAARARPPPAHQPPTVTGTHAPLPSSPVTAYTLFPMLTLFHMLTLAPTCIHTLCPTHALILTCSFPTVHVHKHTSHLPTSPPTLNVYNHTCTHPNIHPHVPILHLRPHSRVPLGITIDTRALPASLTAPTSFTHCHPRTWIPGSRNHTCAHTNLHTLILTLPPRTRAHTCALSLIQTFNCPDSHLTPPPPSPRPSATLTDSHTLSQCLRPTNCPRA